MRLLIQRDPPLARADNATSDLKTWSRDVCRSQSDSGLARSTAAQGKSRRSIMINKPGVTSLLSVRLSFVPARTAGGADGGFGRRPAAEKQAFPYLYLRTQRTEEKSQ
ncbi:unnamed protein product [Arctogadus glacialis]